MKRNELTQFQLSNGRIPVEYPSSVMFLTMCHGTFNKLSEVPFLRPYLYSWRDDNFWLHRIGGWVMGIAIVLHVWVLILPSIFSGYKNRTLGGGVQPVVSRWFIALPRTVVTV